MVFDSGQQRRCGKNSSTFTIHASTSALQGVGCQLHSFEGANVAQRPLSKGSVGYGENGADYRIRTDDLPLTRRLLYQLS